MLTYSVADEAGVPKYFAAIGWRIDQVLHCAEKTLVNDEVLGVRDAVEVLDQLVAEVVAQDLEWVLVALAHLTIIYSNTHHCQDMLRD